MVCMGLLKLVQSTLLLVEATEKGGRGEREVEEEEGKKRKRRKRGGEEEEERKEEEKKKKKRGGRGEGERGTKDVHSSLTVSTYLAWNSGAEARNARPGCVSTMSWWNRGREKLVNHQLTHCMW